MAEQGAYGNSAQFCCEHKTALKKKNYIYLKIQYYPMAGPPWDSNLSGPHQSRTSVNTCPFNTHPSFQCLHLTSVLYFTMLLSYTRSLPKLLSLTTDTDDFCGEHAMSTLHFPSYWDTSEAVGEETVSSTLWGCLAAPKIESDVRQTNRRQASNFIKCLHVCGSLHKRMETRTSDQSRKLLYLLGKELIRFVNLWRIDKQGGLAVGSRWGRSN